MLFFLTLVFFVSSVFSLEISVSAGIEKKEQYSVLTLSNDDPFLCEIKKDQYGQNKDLICTFSKKPKPFFKPVSDAYFIIEPKMVKNNFFLFIKAKKKLFFYPIIFDLTKEKESFEPKTNVAKRWVIIGYNTKLPFIEKVAYNDMSIDFPFFMDNQPLPYVGGLDLRGNPVHIQNSEDVHAYVRVKELFSKKQYENCIDQADTVLKIYPNTLFKSELLFYKLKSLFKLKAYDSVIELSKTFIHEYSSDENIPEVLLLTAVSYYKNGLYGDADYFFDRLFSEHQESVFAKWGYVYKGDMASDGGEYKKANKYYTKALLLTKDIDVAVAAAFRLAKLALINGKYQKAKKYIDKILKAKDDYFYKNYYEAKQMMQDLVDQEHYKEAAKIDEAILKYMSKHHDDYESNLKFLGVWLAKTDQKKKALQALNRYIKEFKDGNYIDEVEETKDKLFFDTKNSGNDKELLEKYDQLIKTYKDSSIGQKALYEKAKLMLKKKMYSDVLQLKNSIEALDETKFKDKKEIIQKAALGLMENALENKQCQIVLDIQKDYNISVSNKWDDRSYECFLKAADYQKAKFIVQRNIKTKDIKEKEKWLYRYARVDFATGNYTEAIEVAKDLISLDDTIDKSKYNDIYRVLFDAYDRIGDFSGMVKTIQKIEELFGLDYKDIDRYVDMVNAGVNQKDDNLIIKYGKKLYDLQNRLHSYAQSPFIEFSLYQAYMSKQMYTQALDVIRSLLKNVTLKAEDKARAKYLEGLVLEKLWKNIQAEDAYKEAIKADKNSAWAKLAKSALDILKN